MNTKIFKQVLKYIFLLTLSLALFWYVLRQVNIAELLGRLSEVNYSWVLLAMLAALISHMMRAWRWNLMLHPLGHYPSFGTTFNAVMIGYLANFVLPRFGEVARCGVLRKNAGVPVSTSFGTVLAERALDLIMLLGIVAITLLLEFERLEAFLSEIFSGGSRISTNAVLWLAVTGGVGLLAGLYLWRLFHPRLLRYPFYQKVMQLGRDLIAGILSIRQIRRQGAFWFMTVMIWVMYYFMSYLVVFSIPQTSNISMLAGLSILAMGGIGMAAPVQGGIGTYHLLVSGVLIVYGASQGDAILLTLLLHTSQSVFVIVIGSISLLISLLKGTKALRHEVEPA
ncbi:MAG: flippase-like domain-containing protein [Bacteroidetes bacterium]|nr:flippase-like domain-containing protein [Bacteroidota bacterium]